QHGPGPGVLPAGNQAHDPRSAARGSTADGILAGVDPRGLHRGDHAAAVIVDLRLEPAEPVGHDRVPAIGALGTHTNPKGKRGCLVSTSLTLRVGDESNQMSEFRA